MEISIDGINNIGNGKYVSTYKDFFLTFDSL